MVCFDRKKRQISSSIFPNFEPPKVLFRNSVWNLYFIRPVPEEQKYLYCAVDSDATAFAHDDCLNTVLANKPLNCDTKVFNTNMDCFFSLVNETFLLVSSIGHPTLISERSKSRTVNRKSEATDKRKLKNFKVIHNQCFQFFVILVLFTGSCRHIIFT